MRVSLQYGYGRLNAHTAVVRAQNAGGGRASRRAPTPARAGRAAATSAKARKAPAKRAVKPKRRVAKKLAAR